MVFIQNDGSGSGNDGGGDEVAMYKNVDAGLTFEDNAPTRPPWPR